MVKLPTASKIERIVKESAKGQVHVFFGGDYSRKPFEAAGRYLTKRLKAAYGGSKVVVAEPKLVTSSGKLVQFLLENRSSESDKIRELHVFSHSWRTGLSLNYGLEPADSDIEDLVKVYGEPVKFLMGLDDLDQFHPCQFRISNLQFLSRDQIKKVRASFAPGALARFWGCNSGVGREADDHYGNIARAFAQYAGIITYGSPERTQFYAYLKDKKKWTTKHAPVGKEAKWPFELRPYRSTKRDQSVRFTPEVEQAKLVVKPVRAPEPHLTIADDMLNELTPASGTPEVYFLAPEKTYMFGFYNLPLAERDVLVKDKLGAAVTLSKLLAVTTHGEWTAKPDGKTIHLATGRDEFMAKINDATTLRDQKTMKLKFHFVVSFKDTDGTTKKVELSKQHFAVESPQP